MHCLIWEGTRTMLAELRRRSLTYLQVAIVSPFLTNGDANGGFLFFFDELHCTQWVFEEAYSQYLPIYSVSITRLLSLSHTFGGFSLLITPDHIVFFVVDLLTPFHTLSL